MQWNYESKVNKSTGYEDLYDILKTYSGEAYKQASPERKSEMIDEVTKIYKDRGIFPITYFNEEGIKEAIQEGIDYEPKIENDVVNTGAGVCTALCNFFMPNLFEAYNINAVVPEGNGSASFKFNNEEYLKKCVRFALQCDGSAMPKSIMSGIRQAGVMPSNFRPMNAKAIYEAYCPEGGVIHDSSCVDDETEFFTGIGWKYIKDYKEGDMVLQYNEDGTANLVYPEEYIHYKSNEPFYEYSNRSFNSCLTGNHEIVYRKRVKDTAILSEKVFKVRQKDIIGKNFRGRIPLSFNYEGDYEIDENILRLIIAVQADGTISNDGSVDYIGITFTKERKIKRFRDIIEKCKIPISRELNIHAGGKDGKEFRFHSHEVCEALSTHGKGKKDFPDAWYNFSKRMKEIVIDEIAYWDGYIEGWDKNYCNTNKHNADMVQFFMNSVGVGSSFGVEDRRNVYGRENCNICYYVARCKTKKYGSYVGFSEKYKLIDKEDKYCFVVPSHMLILRRRNQIFVTGNCGFGGRLTGALTSKKNFSYIGTEPNSATYENLYRLGNAIESVTGRKGSFKIIKQGSEVFRANPEIFDFGFSSPPYFFCEVYTDEPTQCYIKFPNIYEWVDGFVKATIDNEYYMLKHNRYYAINIADFKYDGKIMNYVDLWKDLSIKAGFKYVKDLHLQIPKRAGTNQKKASEGKKERIMLFYKE